jgi:hypothetical protein
MDLPELKTYLDEKFGGVEKRLDSIDVKLHNHLEHYAYQMGGMTKDVSWLKKFAEERKEYIEKNSGGVNEGQNVNIEWLRWGFRLIVGTLMVNILGIVFLAVEFFLKK